jgi:hypothetical protein
MSQTDDGLDVDWYESETAFRNDDPRLTVYSNLNGYINAAADRRWFEDYDELDIGFVADEGLLVLRPTEDGRYSLSRESNKGQGADIHITSAIKHAWGVLDIEDTTRVPLHEEGGHIVADLSELLTEDDDQADDEDKTAGREDDQADDEDDPATEAAASNKAESELPGGDLQEYHTNHPLVEEFLVHAVKQGDREVTSAAIVDAVDGDLDGRAVGGALRQLKNADDAPIHVSKGDEKDDGSAIWRIEPEVDLFDEGSDTKEVDDMARTLQAADDVDSVQELADELDVSEGRARTLAMESGAYSDLTDNVDRPGVER